ncbi:MAG TPA: leucine--tRNA ligase [bacterium]|nr:leucine--tRNA ligase [bacterium]
MDKYNHKKVEDNWKKHWFDNNICKAVDFSPKPKKYILAELPYPSGKFLHLGHMMRYTVPEIYSRFMRMRGYNVLFPMGWDCFGLPAETYAIKNGITPQEAVAEAMTNFKASMQDMGYAIDWAREIDTSDPKYFKWTQWMFIELWKKGLAKVKVMPVWWCKELGVLADEEVLPDPDGPTGKKAERDGHPVEKRLFKQWVLDIPAYADRLLKDLDTVDYNEAVKEGQRNWIGKSEGAKIIFRVKNVEEKEIQLEVFTTRPDTIFGVTFLAISPQHPAVELLIKNTKNEKQLKDYIEKASGLSDLEKQKKDKTGVEIIGVLAENPLNWRRVPIFLADYILADYGTGAIMGVPAHDGRDYEFATKYNLEVVEVINNPKNNQENNDNADSEKLLYEGKGVLKNSDSFNNMGSDEATKAILQKLKEIGAGEEAVTYKIREQIFSRQRYWGEPIPLIYKKDGTIENIPIEQLPLELPIIKDFYATKEGESPLEGVGEWVNTTDSQGNAAKRDTDTMPTWAGSNWYYARYIDPKNDKEFANMDKLKYWMPVDKYFGDAGHTTAHLIYARFWYKFLFDLGLVPSSEPFNWRMSGGILLGADNRKMSKSRPEYSVDPKDTIDNYGADATRTFLAFLGPYSETFPWNENGIKACYRLMRDIYNLRVKVSNDIGSKGHAIEKDYHKTLKNITGMLEDLKMNTGVSEIMKFVNLLKKQKDIPQDIWRGFIAILAPFAPFLSEQLWQEINNYADWIDENSIHLQEWPQYIEELTVDAMVNIPIQINGKLRAVIAVKSEISEAEIREAVILEDKVRKYITSPEDIKNFRYVKGKVVSITI